MSSHSLRGGAGGSAATRRRRKESALIHALQRILSEFSSDDDSETGTTPPANPPSRRTAYRNETRDDDGDDDSELLSSLGTLVNKYASTRGRPQTPLVEQLRQLLDRFTRPVATRRVHFHDDTDSQTPTSDDENAKSSGKGAKTQTRGKGKSFVQHDDSKTNFVRKGDTPQHDPSSSRFKGKKTAQQPHDTTNQAKGKSAFQQFTSNTAVETVERTLARRPPKIVDEISQQICSYHKLCNTLNEGKLPADCCGAMVKTENIGELRALSKIHELQSTTFALVLWDSTDPDCVKPDDAITRWFITEQGAVNLYCVPLGFKLPELPNQPKITKITPKEAEQHEAIRFTIRQEYIPSQWEQACKDPSQWILRNGFIPPNVEVRTYGWKEQQVDGKTLLTGYGKTKASDIPQTLQQSGKSEIFCEPLAGSSRTRAPVQWITKLPDETPHTYFLRSYTMAREQNLPLAARPGSGSSLGIRGGKIDEKQTGKWLLHGVPPEWSPELLMSFLHEQGFASLRNMQPPRYKNGVWTVVAQPPEGKQENTFVYEAGKFVITIRRWQKPKTITRDRWTSYGSSWITGKDHQPADTQMANSDDKDSEVKIISSTTSPEKPATKKVKVDAAPQPILQRKRLYDEPGPNNTVILDLGGDGDCGYRSIAAAMALRSGKYLPEVKENIISLGKTIQAKAHQFLRDHDAWKAAWAIDPSAHEAMQNGPIPKNPQEYLDAVLRPKRWLDGLVAQAVAKSLQTDILIFEKPDKKWKMTARLQCEDGVLRDPIILLLHNEHYRTITSPKDIPKSWKTATPKGVVSRGAGKSVKSFSSWLKPASVIHDKQSTSFSHP